MTIPVLPSPDIDCLDGLDSQALHASLHERVEAAWRLCREFHPGLPRPCVWLDLRGKSAGQAHLGRGGLRFNPTLLEENRLAFMVEVIPHEMAHWLVFHLEEGCLARPHGREWQTIMRRLFGLEARTTHRFDVGRASPTPYRYGCGCREHAFTPRRHGLASRGRAYRCRHCAQTLVYLGTAAGGNYT